MKKKSNNENLLEELKKMAVEYGVENNAMFITAANQYELQQKVIRAMEKSLDDNELMTTKEYVKGRENVYANPIVKELPKHSDSANRTAQTIVDIIKAFGSKRTPESNLAKLINR